VTSEIEWELNVRVVLPLCGGGAGNVGWLDWDAPAGGCPDVVASILTPDNPPIDLPSWNEVTQTGDWNCIGIQEAFNTWDGKTILIPLFDSTCDFDPGAGLSQPAAGLAECPPANSPGNGNSHFYHFPEFAALLLEHAYINDNSSICDLASDQNNTSCIVGRFVTFISSGTVSGSPPVTNPGSNAYGVQLIR
jgi:hypothetical protein